MPLPLPTTALAQLALGLGAATRTSMNAPRWDDAGVVPGRRPMVIAHRGASAETSENSRAAFHLAAAQGADALELDVRRCRSGEIVVMHDPDLQRMTGTPIRVADCPLKQLRALRLHNGEPIPTLEEVLTDPACPSRVNIEIKAEEQRTDGIEAALVDLLRRIDARDRVVISSFNPFVLVRLSLLEPTLPRGFLFHPDTQYKVLRQPFLAPLIRPHLLHPFHTMVTPSLMRWARTLRYRVLPWTVDDPAEWTRLITLGVDGIITNRPGALRRHIEGA